MHSETIQSSRRKGKGIRRSPRKIRSAPKVAANTRAAGKIKWNESRFTWEIAIWYTIVEYRIALTSKILLD